MATETLFQDQCPRKDVAGPDGYRTVDLLITFRFVCELPLRNHTTLMKQGSMPNVPPCLRPLRFF